MWKMTCSAALTWDAPPPAEEEPLAPGTPPAEAGAEAVPLEDCKMIR